MSSSAKGNKPYIPQVWKFHCVSEKGKGYQKKKTIFRLSEEKHIAHTNLVGCLIQYFDHGIIRADKCPSINIWLESTIIKDYWCFHVNGRQLLLSGVQINSSSREKVSCLPLSAGHQCRRSAAWCCPGADQLALRTEGINQFSTSTSSRPSPSPWSTVSLYPLNN